jgi:hypothetical protein
MMQDGHTKREEVGIFMDFTNNNKGGQTSKFGVSTNKNGNWPQNAMVKSVWHGYFILSNIPVLIARELGFLIQLLING